MCSATSAPDKLRRTGSCCPASVVIEVAVATVAAAAIDAVATDAAADDDNIARDVYPARDVFAADVMPCGTFSPAISAVLVLVFESVGPRRSSLWSLSAFGVVSCMRPDCRGNASGNGVSLECLATCAPVKSKRTGGSFGNAYVLSFNGEDCVACGISLRTLASSRENSANAALRPPLDEAEDVY
jgi:hypothetical protein